MLRHFSCGAVRAWRGHSPVQCIAFVSVGRSHTLKHASLVLAALTWGFCAPSEGSVSIRDTTTKDIIVRPPSGTAAVFLLNGIKRCRIRLAASRFFPPPLEEGEEKRGRRRMSRGNASLKELTWAENVQNKT